MGTYSAWESTARCVCSAARDGGKRGAGHIVSPRAQLVRYRIYLFIYYERSYNKYIVQEESANKVIKNYDNAKYKIKSHTSSYANMLPSEKTNI